jgi:LuxR family transcriptional regulator, activator of conjugal transfer of Ti plasmids
MHRVFQRFIDCLSSAEDAVTFSDALAATAAAFDLSSFAYLALPSLLEKEPLVVSTYPASWVRHYVHSRYERLDPVIRQALQSPEPFKWGLGLSTTQFSRAQREFFDEASQFGIRFGFTVPIHDGHGPVAALTFACDQRNVSFEHRVTSDARVLQLMGMYFHANVRRKLMHDNKIDGISLSPRELECLEWSSRGKSAWEIGSILGISRRTAAFHLDNARAKLGVRTVRQAVVRLAESRSRR